MTDQPAVKKAKTGACTIGNARLSWDQMRTILESKRDVLINWKGKDRVGRFTKWKPGKDGEEFWFKQDTPEDGVRGVQLKEIVELTDLCPPDIPGDVVHVSPGFSVTIDTDESTLDVAKAEEYKAACEFTDSLQHLNDE
jgi:hypothetical protein